MGNLRFFCFVALVICWLPSCVVQQRQGSAVLDSRVTMKVYGAEILESVITRLATDTMRDIKFSTLMLLPYRAKAREYRDITVKEILDDQLAGTPIKYQLLGTGLTLYNSETGDYSTNILSDKKNK